MLMFNDYERQMDVETTFMFTTEKLISIIDFKAIESYLIIGRFYFRLSKGFIVNSDCFYKEFQFV